MLFSKERKKQNNTIIWRRNMEWKLNEYLSQQNGQKMYETIFDKRYFTASLCSKYEGEKEDTYIIASMDLKHIKNDTIKIETKEIIVGFDNLAEGVNNIIRRAQEYDRAFNEMRSKK
jgi:flagellar biosynthesis chaperone FliJ